MAPSHLRNPVMNGRHIFASDALEAVQKLMENRDHHRRADVAMQAAIEHLVQAEPDRERRAALRKELDRLICLYHRVLRAMPDGAHLDLSRGLPERYADPRK